LKGGFSSQHFFSSHLHHFFENELVLIRMIDRTTGDFHVPMTWSFFKQFPEMVPVDRVGDGLAK
jgi:hypothetical protein